MIIFCIIYIAIYIAICILCCVWSMIILILVEIDEKRFKQKKEG